MNVGDNGSYLQHGTRTEEGFDGGAVVIFFEEPFPEALLTVVAWADTPIVWFPNHSNHKSFEVRRLDGADEPVTVHYLAVGR